MRGKAPIDAAKAALTAYYRAHKALYDGHIPKAEIPAAHADPISAMRKALKAAGYANEEAVKTEMRAGYTGTSASKETQLHSALSDLATEKGVS